MIFGFYDNEGSTCRAIYVFPLQFFFVNFPSGHQPDTGIPKSEKDKGMHCTYLPIASYAQCLHGALLADIKDTRS